MTTSTERGSEHGGLDRVPMDLSSHERERALLVLADGEVFEGEAAGALRDVALGELVFNTAMSGYQEVITDPSYAGQVVAFTYTHIGNYGVSKEDSESAHSFCNGVITRDITPQPSSWRATEGFETFLIANGVPAICGIDTRRLTRHIRESGAMPCAFGTISKSALQDVAESLGNFADPGLVDRVTTPTRYEIGGGPLRVAVYDFGVKRSMLGQLAAVATLNVVPANTPADEVLAWEPDGVFLSNGPGDPSVLEKPIAAASDLLGKVPVSGICLGHQIIGLALGGRTYKLAFGHHGCNHPVQHLSTGHVEITSQNHNYAVDVSTVRGAELTHVNLNDGVTEGMEMRSANAFSVQYHPEAAPGPHDSYYLFRRFVDEIESRRSRVIRGGPR